MKDAILTVLYCIGCYMVIDWVTNGIRQFNSYTKMSEINKREYNHDHYEKEADRD